MYTKQLFDTIENWCRSGLNFRYNAHTTPVSFYESISDNSIQGLRNQFRIKLKEEQIEHSVQRFPQTRIFVQTFISSVLRVRSVEYFNHTLLLINPLKDEGRFIFRLTVARGLELSSGSECVSNAGENYEISCNKPVFLWLFPKGEKRETGNVKTFLREILEQEYRLHPFNQMRLSNSTDLKEIDRLWANLRSVGPEREIVLPENRKDWMDDFIWLQEIYLHFGWYAELEKVYNKFSAEELKETSLKKCHQRFQMIQTGKGFEIPSKDSELNFLDRYLANYAVPTVIQNFWQQIHYPAYRFQLKKQMNIQTAQYIAFSLQALQQRFFWFSKLNALLSEFLPQKMSGAAGLLLKLKKITSYYPGYKTIEFNPFISAGLVQEIRIAEETAVLSLVRQNKRVFTKLHFKNELFFTIDKTVQYHFDILDKKLTVNPVLFQPPLAASVAETVQVQIDSVSAELPLIWRKFEVTLNKVRLKFLRKKDRFQVSIRGKKYTKTIHINKQTIESVSGHYPVFYIPVSKTESRTEAALFNEWGALPNPCKPAFIHGRSFDSFHSLQEQVQVSISGQKKSHLLTINLNQIENERAVDFGRDFRVTSRYSTGYTLKSQVTDGYLSSFLYTKAELLQNRCLLFTNNPGETAEQFYDAVGFYPGIKTLDEIHPQENVFVVIANETYKGETVSEQEGYKIISLFPDGRQKGILVNPKALKSVLIAHFDRNKFDFNNQL